jgi:hypothetical protein
MDLNPALVNILEGCGLARLAGKGKHSELAKHTMSLNMFKKVSADFLRDWKAVVAMPEGEERDRLIKLYDPYAQKIHEDLMKHRGKVERRFEGYGDTIKMTKSDFLKEHKNLVRILTKGTKKQQLREAQEQVKEVQSYS